MSCCPGPVPSPWASRPGWHCEGMEWVASALSLSLAPSRIGEGLTLNNLGERRNRAG